MPNFFDAYLNALLADATYALDRNRDDLSRAELIDALKDRMTPTVAEYVAGNFTMVTHIETD
ncbi:MAG: hypothetical protein AAB353_05160, partial [Candidatus Hydrogenedentota bacterium]